MTAAFALTLTNRAVTPRIRAATTRRLREELRLELIRAERDKRERTRANSRRFNQTGET